MAKIQISCQIIVIHPKLNLETLKFRLLCLSLYFLCCVDTPCSILNILKYLIAHYCTLCVYTLDSHTLKYIPQILHFTHKYYFFKHKRDQRINLTWIIDKKSENLLSHSLKGVFAKNERGYRLNVIKKRFWSLLILLLSVAFIRRKLLKTSHTE